MSSRITLDLRKGVEDAKVILAMQRASRTILGESQKRIFDNGLASDGNKIGEYSTKPIYIGKTAAPKGGGTYYPGGYKEFKQKTRGTTLVDLKLFGRLQTDYETSKQTISGSTITYSLKDPFNADKKDWMEAHFKKDIFSLTDGEIERLNELFEAELFRFSEL